MHGEILGTNDDACNLYYYLATKFDEEVVGDAFRKYKIRTTDERWDKSTVFYQIDDAGKHWAGKIMNYDRNTGKRIKKPYNRIYWVHKLLSRPFQLEQHLFGEHLLDNSKANYLVESEKTALICSIVYPESVWVANGGMNNVNARVLKPLSEMTRAYAIPDKGAYGYWVDKLQPLGITTLRTLESNGFVKEGMDIADWILTDK